MAASRELGLEIKSLRDKRNITAKDLAVRVGLSPSQLSRIETGQRRIDAPTLAKIAGALRVPSSYFFPDQHLGLAEALDLPMRYESVAKLIRLERRKRHLSAQELGSKIGKGKFFILDLEEGKCRRLRPEVLKKIGKVLKIDPWKFWEVQQIDFEQAYQTAVQLSGRGVTGQSSRPIRIAGDLATGYPVEFDGDGWPPAITENGLALPVDEECFALTVIGDAMRAHVLPSFAHGDLVAFGMLKEAAHKDFVFARLAERKPLFRQVFFDDDATVRLQPLNRDERSTICPREAVVRLYPLVASIKMAGSP